MRCLIKIVLVLIALCQVLPAHAVDSIALGPIVVVLSINNVEIEVPITSELSVDSQGGVLNANGAVTISADAGTLGTTLEAIAKTLLPHKFNTVRCNYTVSNLSQVKVISIAHEARISGSVDIQSENCRAPQKVSIELVLVPVWTDKSTIRFSLPRDPKVTLPWQWRVLAKILAGDLQKAARKDIQEFLDTSDNAKLSLPNIEGINAAFQGTNFNSDGTTIVFRVIGDAHFETRAMQKLIKDVLAIPKFEIAIKLD